MSSNQLPLWVPTIAAALVGFIGVVVGGIIENRREDKREDRRWAREKEIRSEARIDRRRQELAQAIAEFASTVAKLRRADYQRGLERLSQLSEAERRPAREKTYELRGNTESKMHLVSLLSDQDKDRDLVKDARAVVEMCDDLSDKSACKEDLDNRNTIAKDAMLKLIEKAGRRIQNLP
jgi:hypothetical protein